MYTAVAHRTGNTEPVITPEQWDSVSNKICNPHTPIYGLCSFSSANKLNDALTCSYIGLEIRIWEILGLFVIRRFVVGKVLQDVSTENKTVKRQA
jgi:hypothetical protein